MFRDVLMVQLSISSLQWFQLHQDEHKFFNKQGLSVHRWVEKNPVLHVGFSAGKIWLTARYFPRLRLLSTSLTTPCQ